VSLEVGGVYEWQGVIFACVAECEAETARFKRKEPGYMLLILRGQLSGDGTTLTVSRGAPITVKAKRFD
jgi:hypothetical protein